MHKRLMDDGTPGVDDSDSDSDSDSTKGRLGRAT
jgi:hypothetical protein